MPKPAAIVPDTCSAAQLAALLGIGARRVRELAEAGVIPRAPRGRYSTGAAVAAYAMHLREVAAGRRGGSGDGETLDLAQERALLARSQREAVELKLARDRGELVNAHEVRIAFAGMVTAARNRLRGLASAAKGRIPTLSTRDVEEIERLVDHALTELAEGAGSLHDHLSRHRQRPRPRHAGKAGIAGCARGRRRAGNASPPGTSRSRHGRPPRRAA